MRDYFLRLITTWNLDPLQARPPQDYLLWNILPAATRDLVILGSLKTITATFAIVANSMAPSLWLPTLPATSIPAVF